MGCTGSKPAAQDGTQHLSPKKKHMTPVTNVENPPKAPEKSASKDSTVETSTSDKRSSGEMNLGVLMAVSRLQRKARRMKALKAAQKEQQWKLFADLDTQDEAEMLHLAVFMQTLIDSVPNPVKSLSPFSKNGVEDDDDFDPIELGAIKVAEKKISFQRVEDCMEFDIETSKIDANVCEEIVKCYRNGGKLTRKSVVKILRRAYKTLPKLPNVTRMSVPEGSKLTVVGDLHGQLSDLLHILEESGMPSETNKFVFNGDFVDRGDKGVEIMVILFAMFVAHGVESVCLNRGNHEDLPVCRVYGFETEVKTKYDELLFEMFAEVFNFLPLFSLVNDSIFIVHGGLFHTPSVDIAELDEIVRSDYYVKPPVPYPQNIRGLTPEEARKEFMKQLQRDALWSDPTDEVGCYLNPRGAGVSFGPDIAAAFMAKNGIDMVVRSHECVFSGFDLPYDAQDNNVAANMGFNFRQPQKDRPAERPLLCTLFSASNYIGGDNEGAFLMFLNHKFSDSRPVGGKSTLHYAVRHYKTSAALDSEIDTNNRMSLRELILKRKGALLSAFEAVDTEAVGFVSRVEWADIMQRVTLIKIRWLSIIETLAPVECLTPSSVNYPLFLGSFSVARKLEGDGVLGEGAVVTGQTGNAHKPTEAQMGCMDEMYGQRRKLETVFYFFDSNGDGVRDVYLVEL
jgi:serine/threonine-protein phosphatase with EF-hand domain